jgi:hypothetical protein
MQCPKDVIDQVRVDHAPADLDLSVPQISEGSLVHFMRVVRDRGTHPAPLPRADGRNLTLTSFIVGGETDVLRGDYSSALDLRSS